MAIPVCGTFEYRVHPRKAKKGQDWVGSATSTRDSSMHPGLAGAHPHFQISNGSVTLQPAESALSQWTNRHFREWDRSPSRVSFDVGDALSLVLEDGDTLHLERSATGDLGIALLREEKLILALGAVFDMPLGADVKLANDPRMQDPYQYHIAASLERPETKLVWIDPGEGELSSWKARLADLPVGRHLVLAVRGSGYALADETRKIVPRGWSSITFASVNPKFADEKTWREAMKSLTGGPPKDPYVSVCIRGTEIRLREGQKELFETYVLQLGRYFRPGMPGQAAILAIAQLSPSLPEDAVAQSLAPFLELGE